MDDYCKSLTLDSLPSKGGSLPEVQGIFRYMTIPVASLLVTVLGIVDIFRKSMRPALTGCFIGVTTWITHKAWIILKATNVGANAMTASQADVIFTNVTNTVVYLTVSCVTWWFGNRRMAKFLMKMK